jgi:hypothetical protein
MFSLSLCYFCIYYWTSFNALSAVSKRDCNAFYLVKNSYIFSLRVFIVRSIYAITSYFVRASASSLTHFNFKLANSSVSSFILTLVFLYCYYNYSEDNYFFSVFSVSCFLIKARRNRSSAFSSFSFSI